MESLYPKLAAEGGEKGLIPNHNGFITPEDLKPQEYFNEITKLTERNQMKLNTHKSKIMIFNYTKNHQFSEIRQYDSRICQWS